jgi:hypothetical protein
MDIDKMNQKFPGLKAAFQKLRHGKPLTQVPFDTEKLPARLGAGLKEVDTMVDWIDEFITCSLNKARVGEVVSQRAKEVQTHGHTKSCHKKGPDCRYV